MKGSLQLALQVLRDAPDRADGLDAGQDFVGVLYVGVVLPQKFGHVLQVLAVLYQPRDLAVAPVEVEALLDYLLALQLPLLENAPFKEPDLAALEPVANLGRLQKQPRSHLDVRRVVVLKNLDYLLLLVLLYHIHAVQMEGLHCRTHQLGSLVYSLRNALNLPRSRMSCAFLRSSCSARNRVFRPQ